MVKSCLLSSGLPRAMFRSRASCSSLARSASYCRHCQPLSLSRSPKSPPNIPRGSSFLLVLVGFFPALAEARLHHRHHRRRRRHRRHRHRRYHRRRHPSPSSPPESFSVSSPVFPPRPIPLITASRPREKPRSRPHPPPPPGRSSWRSGQPRQPRAPMPGRARARRQHRRPAPAGGT